VTLAAITVKKVTALKRQDNESELTIFFTDSSGQVRSITFPRPVLPDLLALLLGMQAPKSGQPIDIPAIEAERVEPFQQTGASGPVSGLAFFLTGGWLMPFAIPKAVIPTLKRTVADLELLDAETDGQH